MAPPKRGRTHLIVALLVLVRHSYRICNLVHVSLFTDFCVNCMSLLLTVRLLLPNVCHECDSDNQNMMMMMMMMMRGVWSR